MSDEETIHVADVSAGNGGAPGIDPGTSVDLPVVEILTGRGFITGKSGSGKSNTASVFIENLLDNNFPVLIVDTDGEYYGLKEEYEILHAGADEECDIVVSPEHAEKIAGLALEQNVPIILDVSGYLEESEAQKLLLEVVKQLFAKEKKLKKPFLLVLEECHEYIPEGGGMNETGKMLIKVGKRGRKHGLGIVGISQRPADVKKDFITQCDWLTWHRLTWDNDTKVVSRILGSTYANEIEDMDDGEAFMMTDWDESIRRIQFHRKETFDAGATPGLEDFERPELKSVSGDLVSELQSISDDQARHESEMADLRQELDKKRQQINQLEQELADAEDMSNMADQFAQALLQKADAPYRGGAGRNAARPARDGQQAATESDESDPSTTDGPPQHRQSTSGQQGGEDEDTGTDIQSRDSETVPSTKPDEASAEMNTTDEPFEGSSGPDSPVDDPTKDVEPVSRKDVAESALRFDEALELGTREAVIQELRGRVEKLPELSVSMLGHYRREGVSEPIAAHIDAGGDGDSGHAYSRNRPIRKTGLIRHAGRGHYAYAVPDLIREAYADRLTDDEIDAMVAEVEMAFVPPGDRDTESDANSEQVCGDVEDAAVATEEDTVAEVATGEDSTGSVTVQSPGTPTGNDSARGVSATGGATDKEGEGTDDSGSKYDGLGLNDVAKKLAQGGRIETKSPETESDRPGGDERIAGSKIVSDGAGPTTEADKGHSTSSEQRQTRESVDDRVQSETAEPTKSGESASVEQDGTATVEQGGTTTVEQGGTTTVEQGGTTTVEQGGTTTIDQEETTTTSQDNTPTVAPDEDVEFID